MEQKTMKAVVWNGKDDIVLTDRPMPKIEQPGDAIVRVTLSTICSSDIHILHDTVPRAKKGTVLGHEFVGEVVETGADVKTLKCGDRVSVNVETFCGECWFCKRGYVNNCVHGGWELGCRIDGCQAEYVRVPMADQGCDLIPEGVTDEQALMTGDVLATGYWAAKEGELGPEDVAVVLGAGPTGLCTMMSARLYNPKAIVAVDPDPVRRDAAIKNGWCDIVLDPKTDDVDTVVKSLTDGRGADRVFEVAGAKKTFEQAWQLARPNGIVVVVALYPEAQSIPLHQMYGKNLTFKTGGVDANSSARILELIAEGKLDTTPLYTHSAPLNDVLKGYEVFGNQRDGVIKWLITPYERGEKA